jgi:hypothetical protein
MRDKDVLKCQFCGNIIFSWNAGVIYSKELISGPTKTDFKKVE